MSDEELFGYDDLQAILAKAPLMPQRPDELFRAWGINPRALLRFLREGAEAGAEEFDEMGAAGADKDGLLMIVGFALGFQTAQELRMREEVITDDANEEDD